MYNDWRYKSRRRELRKSQTEAERILWQRLRGKRFLGLKFFRQYSIGFYILDFYCPHRRLAIELDGSQHQHESAAQYDAERTSYLNALRVTVLRFWNNEVFESLDDVLSRIEMEADIPDNPSALRAPPL